MRDPGIEPGSVPWQGTILPLNQPRLRCLPFDFRYIMMLSACSGPCCAAALATAAVNLGFTAICVLCRRRKWGIAKAGVQSSRRSTCAKGSEQVLVFSWQRRSRRPEAAILRPGR